MLVLQYSYETPENKYEEYKYTCASFFQYMKFPTFGNITPKSKYLWKIEEQKNSLAFDVSNTLAAAIWFFLKYQKEFKVEMSYEAFLKLIMRHFAEWCSSYSGGFSIL